MDDEQPFLDYGQWAERIHRDGYRKALDSPDYIVAKNRRLDEVTPAPKSETPPPEHQDKSTLMHLCFLAGLIGLFFLWNYDGLTLVITEGALITTWVYMGYRKSVELQRMNEPALTHQRMTNNRDIQSRASDRRVQHRLDGLWAEHSDVEVPLTSTDPTVPRPEPDPNFTASKAGPLIRNWMQYLGAINPRLDLTEEGTATVSGDDYFVMINHGRVPVSADQVLSIFQYRASKNWHRKRPLFFSRSGYSREAIDRANSHGIRLFLYRPEAGTVEARSESAHYILKYGITGLMNDPDYTRPVFKGLFDAPIPFSAADGLWEDVPEEVVRVANWMSLASGSEPEVFLAYADIVFLNAPGISALVKVRDDEDWNPYSYLRDSTAEAYAVLVPPENVYVAFADLFSDIQDMGNDNAEENRWYDSEDYPIGAIHLGYASMGFTGVNESGKAALIAASKRSKNG